MAASAQVCIGYQLTVGRYAALIGVPYHARIAMCLHLCRIENPSHESLTLITGTC